ncbi:MAG: NAD(+) diphosphatase [Firmicutes bacterium]|nr:NAD(+) diphosphatase [Bacillota bacterium]
MIHEIAPHVLYTDFHTYTAAPDDVALVFRGGDILLRRGDKGGSLPRFADLPYGEIPAEAEYLFRLDGQRFFLAPPPPVLTEDAYYADANVSLRMLAPSQDAFAAVTGLQLYRWRDSRRFCGRCAAPMQKGQRERSAVCPYCGLVEYPKIAPAVIVAITDGKRLLMAKNRRSAYKRYALIAGYCEIGETFEQTVRREIQEEVGLQVKNIQYYASQPWAFSDSVMVGFFAELDGDDRIVLQEEELSDARWFPFAEIPENGSRLSISQELIEAVRRGEHLRYLSRR